MADPVSQADAVRFRLDRQALLGLLEGEEGPVARDLLRRAIKVEASAKRICPVDTGRLRSSITHALTRDTQGLAADVGTNVEYAVFVELGTSRMPAKPFLRPALVEGAD